MTATAKDSAAPAFTCECGTEYVGAAYAASALGTVEGTWKSWVSRKRVTPPQPVALIRGYLWRRDVLDAWLADLRASGFAAAGKPGRPRRREG